MNVAAAILGAKGQIVAHAYALHVTVEAECLCCHSLQPFQFSSPSDQVVCSHCVHHLGAEKAERRDLDHIRLWSGLHDSVRDALAASITEAAEYRATSTAKITDLETTVSGLVDGVADRFASGHSSVRPLIETEVVGRAERNTELANRRTDRLMATLWSIEDLHHDDLSKPSLCACGRTMAACAEWKIVEPQRRVLREWESKNLALLAAGERHGLPAAHPAVRASQPPASRLPASRLPASGLPSDRGGRDRRR